MTAPTPNLPAHDNPTVVRLFEAAADAFADKGFHATTTRDIASRAGLSPAGVYVHFASKEDLLFQLSRVGHEEARDALAAAAAEADSPTAALEEVISAFARWHAQQYQVARIVQYEFRHLAPEHQREVLTLRREIDGVVERIITDGVASGEFSVEDTRVTALAAMSLVVDVARWYHPGVRRTPEDIGAEYGRLALRLVGAA
ncbi:TetR/AcrR family transcriptional regulator [Janibacter cremeus]|uniref:TetR/AcrR family transcriptional regulator n=1 Tax=Janibacter cremeus TaxID=1285192 RepID=UPI0023F6F40F|nr:TetR/AcrR family transcriptional regulator [Janibacter cremeus]WEV79552.1 TetR/AcrR family transcriptional regulator [Janibacter cremeus]